MISAHLTPGVQRMLDRLGHTPSRSSTPPGPSSWPTPLHRPDGEHHGKELNAVWRNFLGTGSRVRHTPSRWAHCAPGRSPICAERPPATRRPAAAPPHR
ncbi:hypothetical protein NKH77_40755 [Streptomyces sp. M19]